MYCLFLVADKEYFGREVVRVTVEIGARRKCTPRIALAVALGVFQEVFVEHVGAVEVPAVVRTVGQIARNDDLVEKIPLALVGECTDARI